MKRSAVFFESDLRAAADECAIAMEDHGTDDLDRDALAERIAEAIRRFFHELA